MSSTARGPQGGDVLTDPPLNASTSSPPSVAAMVMSTDRG
jgi:hypothetical protein